MARQNVSILPIRNTDAEILSIFGNSYNGRIETGVHLGVTSETNVYSVTNGEIVDVGYNTDYGNYIIIKDIYSSVNLGYLYGNLLSTNVSVGQNVTRNQRVGRIFRTLILEIQGLTNRNWVFSQNTIYFIDPSQILNYNDVVGDTLYYSYTPPTPPTPTPVTNEFKRNKFPWVLYVRKFRNRY